MEYGRESDMESKEEYKFLQEKKMRIKDMQDNLMIATLTICVAILGAAYTSNNMNVGLLLFCVAIPMQILINVRQNEIAMITAYTNIFLAGNKLQYDINEKKMIDKMKGEKIYGWIRKFSISVLGVIAIAGYIFSLGYMKNINIPKLVSLILAIVLGLSLIFVNAQFTTFPRKVEIYEKAIKKN